MRTAKLYVFALTVECPYCGEPIAEPSSGSHTWEVSQIVAGQTVTCLCGMSSPLPSTKKFGGISR